VHQGTSILDELNQHYNHARQKDQIHKYLSVSDLKIVYSHYAAAYDLGGIPHPPNHPINLKEVKSKTQIIEGLTEDYGHSPLSFLKIYHKLSEVQDPSSPVE
jgi:hypothetical protein